MDGSAQIRQGEAPHGLHFFDTRVVIHQAAAQSPVGLSVQEHWLPFGYSPPLHQHLAENEIFHILAGEVRFQLGGEEILARAGQSLAAPAGVPHSFFVDSAAGAHFLVLAPGPDFEGFLRAVSRPAPDASLPAPLSPPTPEEGQRLQALALSHRIELLGPPMMPRAA
jgi:quercetin dioxygenase-like cupin family protein